MRVRGPRRYPGFIPKALRRTVLKYKGELCAYCGLAVADTLDHVVPLSKGGPTTFENLVPACEPCNRAKGSF